MLPQLTKEEQLIVRFDKEKEGAAILQKKIAQDVTELEKQIPKGKVIPAFKKEVMAIFQEEADKLVRKAIAEEKTKHGI